MTGTVAGLVALGVGLALFACALFLVAGPWGLLAASVAWVGCGVVLIKPEVLYARNP